MEQGALLKAFVNGVAGQIKRRRILYYAIRGGVCGLTLALIPFLLKGIFGPSALLIGLGLCALGLLAGGIIGFSLPLRLEDAARLADRRLGLHERLSTALHWVDQADPPSIVRTLVADAVSRAQGLDPPAAVPRLWPAELKWAPLPLLLLLLLFLAPAIPIPAGFLPQFTASAERDADDEQERELATEERTVRSQRPALDRLEMVERDLGPKQGSPPSRQQGDLSAIYKDTALAGQRPDFNSFLKRGDDRLRMLEQVDRLPDLKQDFTRSPSRVVFQRMKTLFGGLRPDQISPEKLRDLLNEMERLGRKSGDWGQDVGEGMEALEGGQMERAMSAMERALAKMRAMEEGAKGRRGLQGGKTDERGKGRDRGRGNDGGEQDEGDGEGSLPGQGRSPHPKGNPSARLKTNPLDMGVEGEARPGRKQGFDTNLLGRGANAPSQLPYMTIYSQYRKMMEETMAREQIPFDYQGQIKDYFQSLEER